jgi:ABC-type transport system involved in multi-copper enzyme maturation permease subunit
MIRLIGGELFKLRTTRMYLGLLVAATGLVVLVTALQFALGGDASLTIEGAASVIETEADLRSVLDVSGVAVLFTLILGATALAGEHRHRTIATTFLVTPTRRRVVVAKVAGYTVAGAVFGIVVEAAAVVVAVGWLAATGNTIPFGSTVVAGLALTPVATGLAAGFGVGISAAIPNQLAAVLVGFGWVMVAEQLLGGLVPDLAQWLPFTGAGTAITGQHPEIGVVAGLGLFVSYLLVIVAVGLQVTRRRDIA